MLKEIFRYREGKFMFVNMFLIFSICATLLFGIVPNYFVAVTYQYLTVALIFMLVLLFLVQIPLYIKMMKRYKVESSVDSTTVLEKDTKKK